MKALGNEIFDYWFAFVFFIIGGWLYEIAGDFAALLLFLIFLSPIAGVGWLLWTLI